MRHVSRQHKPLAKYRIQAVLALVLICWLGFVPAGGVPAYAVQAIPGRIALSFQPTMSGSGSWTVQPATGNLAASGLGVDLDAIPTDAELMAQAVYLTNQERARAGLLPLKAAPSLMAAALGHSQDMAEHDFFDHDSSDGGTLVNRLIANNYLNWTAGAENIAAGFDTAEAVVNAWMNSAGHRNNILNPDLREIGVGYFYQPDDQPNVRLPDDSLGGPYFYYWTQDFGSRYNVYPVIINLEAPTTSNRQVTLAIRGQGWAQQMQVSNRADFAGASWEPFATTKAWTLTPGNGVHTVYVKLRNAYDQEIISSDEIELVGGQSGGATSTPTPTATPQPTVTSTPTPTPTLSVTPRPTATPRSLPPIKVSINNGQPFTNRPGVTLTLSIPEMARKLEASSDAGFTDLKSLPIQPQVTWQLDDSLEGTQCVYVRYMDQIGTTSPIASACTIYDSDPPSGYATVIANNGLSLLVDVDVWDPLSGVADMAVALTSNDLTWQPYAPVVKLPLPPGGQGAGDTPVVYARFRDRAGNESPVYRSDEPPATPKQVFLPLTTGGR